jgi:glycosyltransferase involved in cell wall biosynthesis
MARVLILAAGIPDDLTHGLHLRVYHLCRELARRHTCFLVAFTDRDPGRAAWDSSPFSAVDVLPPMPDTRSSPLRHLRLSNGRMLARYAPAYLGRMVEHVASRARDWRTDLFVSFAPGLAEVAIGQHGPRILDFADCLSLVKERQLANIRDNLPLSQRLQMGLQRRRIMRGERHTMRHFDATMTVSPPDRRRLLEISGLSEDRVVLVQNGVSPEALAVARPPQPAGRSVVFWGNLGFPPNETAVRYFHDRIFLPYLADRGVDWHIVGRDASPEIEAMADHPRIHLDGFQPELFEYVADKGVMVNPMVEGSGLKNKVLEAFAVGVPVVSTSLGVDAFDVASGEQCLIADAPLAFADSVDALLDDGDLRDRVCSSARSLVEERYTWGRIGNRFSELVATVSGKVA